jgi:hypothetical protein
MRLLQEAENRRRQFRKMICETERETDVDGAVSLRSVLAAIDREIEKR